LFILELVFYTVFDVSNLLQFPVSLSLSDNFPDLDYSQEPYQHKFLINAKSDKTITLKYSTSPKNGFDNDIAKFVNLEAISKKGNILLNKKKMLTFDATKDKVSNKVTISFDERLKEGNINLYTKIKYSEKTNIIISSIIIYFNL